MGGKTKEKKLLQGPEKDLNLAEVPISPDHRYVALHQLKSKPAGKGGTGSDKKGGVRFRLSLRRIPNMDSPQRPPTARNTEAIFASRN